MFADRLYIWSVSDRLFLWKNSGVDIRKMGSGNAGSTNALRTMGIKAGMITLLGDCFKCVIAVLVVAEFTDSLTQIFYRSFRCIQVLGQCSDIIFHSI